MRWKYEPPAPEPEEPPRLDRGGGRERPCAEENCRLDQMAMGSVMPLALCIVVDGDVSARPARRARWRDIVATSMLKTTSNR